MRDVVRQLIGALEQGREQIVCQVVETRGSTPQKAGALMVVDPDGGQAGTLGGGCVEAEVKQRAIRRIGQNGACLNSFVLDHDYAWADGLICGGKMVVVTEAVRGEGPLCYFRALHALLDSGEGFTETIVVDAEKAGTAIGTRGLFDHQRELVAAWPDGALTNDFGERVTDLAERPKPNLRAGVALLPTLPRVRLLIVGGGHVGQAVAGLAAQADFDIWVVDDRHQYANAERFPSARKILVGPLDELLRDPPVTAQTYALIVTRGHGHDQEALYYLAPTAAPYVGLIGSRRKIRMIFENLQEMGIPAAALARVSAPVGFDIGSQTVPEIAISIVAELIARRNLGAHALPLRTSADPSAAAAPARLAPA